MAIIIETCPKCGHDLQNITLMSYPPIRKKECWNCGWSWTGKSEEVVRVPFGGNDIGIINQPSLNDYLNTYNSKDLLINNFEQSACEGCSNNPKNGGSGICNCTLGQMQFT